MATAEQFLQDYVLNFFLNFLVNALWQVLMVVSVALLCGWVLRRTAAKHQHLLWVTALAFSFCMAVVTCVHFYPRSAPIFSGQSQAATVMPASTQLPASQPLPSTSQDVSSANSTAPAASMFPPVSGTVALFVISAFLLLLLYRCAQFFAAWKRTNGILHEAFPLQLSARAQAVLEKCEAALGVTGTHILVSQSVHVPMTAGGLHPVIILPEKLLLHADDNALTTAIGHELAHVVRRDYLFNLLYELIYIPLSFHPAAALARRRIHQTRELRCDELVTEKLLDPEAYARSLVELAGSAMPLGRPLRTITVAINDADILEERIMSILKPKSKTQRNSLLLLASALLFALPCIAAMSYNVHVNIAQPVAAVEPATVTTMNPAQEPTTAAQKTEEQAREDREKKEREKSRLKLTPKTVEQEKDRRMDTIVELQRALEDRQKALQEQDSAKSLTPQQREALEHQITEIRTMLAKNEQQLTTVMTEDGKVMTYAYGDSPEARSRREMEERERDKQQSEIAQRANITMDNAIQVAVREHPGKVLECNLHKERDLVVYSVVIVAPDGAGLKRSFVMVNAMNGQIVDPSTFENRKERTRD